MKNSWTLRHPDDLDTDEQFKLKQVLASCPHLQTTAGHVGAFAQMLNGRHGEQLIEWMAALAEHAIAAGDLSARWEVIAINGAGNPHEAEMPAWQMVDRYGGGITSSARSGRCCSSKQTWRTPPPCSTAAQHRRGPFGVV